MYLNLLLISVLIFLFSYCFPGGLDTFHLPPEIHSRPCLPCSVSWETPRIKCINGVLYSQTSNLLGSDSGGLSLRLEGGGQCGGLLSCRVSWVGCVTHRRPQTCCWPSSLWDNGSTLPLPGQAWSWSAAHARAHAIPCWFPLTLPTLL